MLLAYLLLMGRTRVAFGQERPDRAPGIGDSSGGWVDRLSPEQWFEQQRDALFRGMLRLFTDAEHGLPALLGRWVQQQLAALWDAAWSFFAPFNVFTQIPTWVLGLPFLDQAWGVLFPIAAVGLGFAAVATLGLSVLSVLGGRPPSTLFAGLRHFMRGLAGLLIGTRFLLLLIDVSNGFSRALLDPAGGLPGLDRMTAFGQALSYPILAIIYLGFACCFFCMRLKVVFTVVACLILAPVMFFVGAMPFRKAQDAYDVWLTYFLAATFVSVLQAVFLGIGANILILGTSVFGQDAPSEFAALGVGVAAIYAAGTVPGTVMAAMVNRTMLPPGTLHNAAWLAMQLASLVVFRVPVIPPGPASAYPPPWVPDHDRAVAGWATTRLGVNASTPPQIIEYVPPMLPPPS